MYEEKVKEDDDIFTVEEFEDMVECGGLIDYDGFGFPAKDNKLCTSIVIKPSSYKNDLPIDATHIVWYNR